MRILLIQPPVEDFYQTAIRTQPLGLACLAAALEQHGHCVSILDCQEPGKKKQLPLPARFSYLKNFYAPADLSPFKLFGRYSHFGIPWEELARRIAGAAPDLIGISCQFTPYVGETKKTAQIAKKVLPGIPVIAGGAHASALPAEVLKSRHIDYVIIGEGEESLPQLADALAAGLPVCTIRGLAYKDSGAVRINARSRFIDDLDRLPLPARHLLDPSWYGVGTAAVAMLLTSRGCPQRCSYCSVHRVMGSRLRLRSPEHVLAEMQECHNRFGITAFDFEDDNFTYDRDRALVILKAISATFGERRLRLFAMNGLSLISLDPELLEAMQRAGFERLDLSLGSSSRELSRRMGRPADSARADAALDAAARLGLPVTAYIILGLPDHRLEDMIDSIVYLMQRPALLGPSIFYPSPGTRTSEQVREMKLCDLDNHALLRSSAFPVETPHCSRLDLVTLLRLCRWINFIKDRLRSKNVPSCTFSDLPALFPEAPDLSAGRPDPLSPEQAGWSLTVRLLAEKQFFGIKRRRKTAEAGYGYEAFTYETSRKAVEIFLGKAQALAIRAPAKN